MAWVQLVLEDEVKREEWLKSVGCPAELPSKGIQQEAVPPAARDRYGRKVKPTKVAFGESWNHTSITQKTDDFLSLREESACDERIELSPDWQRYVDFFAVFAGSLPADRREKVKELAVMEARSRYWEVAPEIPAVLGTIDELRSRWERGEIWFRQKYTRQKWTIYVEENPPGMPPDDPEDFDEGEEPNGHWEGLKWIAEEPRKGKMGRRT